MFLPVWEHTSRKRVKFPTRESLSTWKFDFFELFKGQTVLNLDLFRKNIHIFDK